MPSVAFLRFFVLSQVLQFRYPNVYRDDQRAENFHGQKVPDPYHWLEDLDSQATKDFVEAQMNLTSAFLSNFTERDKIQKAAEKYLSSNYEVLAGAPARRGQRIFFKDYTPDGHEVILMLNWSWSDNGTRVGSNPEVVVDLRRYPEYVNRTIGEYSVSPDGHMIAFHVLNRSVDATTIHFVNATSKEYLPDIILWAEPILAPWTNDSLGTFYSSRTQFSPGKRANLQSNKVYYHRLGTEQSLDVVVAQFPDNPSWSLYAFVSDDYQYLLVYVTTNAEDTTIYVAPLQGKRLDWGFQRYLVPIFKLEDHVFYDRSFNINSTIYFITNKNANNYRLISVDVDPITGNTGGGILPEAFPGIMEVIPEDSRKILAEAHLISKDLVVLVYYEEAKAVLEVTSLGNISHGNYFTVPDPGQITYLNSPQNLTHPGFYFFYRSFRNPRTIYSCSVDAGEINCRVVWQAMSAELNLQKLTVKQEFYQSKDGTSVPMFIIHKKEFILPNPSPTILSGYGGYGLSSLPTYDIWSLFFIENFGGVYAVANIRGGGEYGSKWKEGGSRFKKQNTFNDFIAAAEFLIEQGYTNSSMLAVTGGSNGGLTVAASVNQRPQLFGAAVIQAGILDMLHFQHYTVGPYSCRHYGCSDKEDEFRNLMTFSPPHNIRMPNKDQYPAIFVTVDHDDERVVPMHSYKYIAELQYRLERESRQTNPVLLRTSRGMGHSDNSMELQVDILAFCAATLGWKLQVPSLAVSLRTFLYPIYPISLLVVWIL